MERILKNIYDFYFQKVYIIVEMGLIIKYIEREYLNNNFRIFCGFQKFIFEIFLDFIGII